MVLLTRPKTIPAVSLALLLTCFGSERSWVEVRLVQVVRDIARIARRYHLLLVKEVSYRGIALGSRGVKDRVKGVPRGT